MLKQKDLYGKHIIIRDQQAGTGPSRRHIQGSKIAKRFPSLKYSLLQYSEIGNFSTKNFFEKLHTQKMDRVARRGPLARAPGALKSHNAEKLKGGPFGLARYGNNKKLKGGKFFTFGKKSHSAEKTVWRTLWEFPTSILTQNSKKNEGGPFGGKFFFEKKVSQCQKNERGTLWSRPVWYVTRKNRKNLFGSVR